LIPKTLTIDVTISGVSGKNCERLLDRK
jgi:hypothetical protein